MKSFLLGLILFCLSISPTIGQKNTNPKELDQTQLLSSTSGIDKLILIADSLINYGHLDGVRQIGDQMVLASQKLDYNLGVAEGLLILSRWFKLNTDYDSAFYFSDEAMKLTSVDNAGLVGRVHFWKAKMFNDKGEYDSAIYNLVEAQRHIEKTENNEGLISILREKADIYNKLDDHSQALKASRKALSLSADNSIFKMDALNATGITFQNLQKYDSSLYYYEQGLSIARALNLSRDLVVFLNNIAVVYEETDRFQEALDYYFQTLEIDILNKDTLGLTYSYMGPAITYHRMNQLDSALYYAEKTLHYAVYLNAKQRIEKGYEIMISIHKARGDHEALANYYDLLLKHREDLLEESKYKSIKELEVQFETEKKEQQIASLEVENQNEELKRNIFAASLIVSILIGGSLIWGLRYRIRKNQQLREKEELLYRQQVEQYKSELDIYTNRLVDKSTRVEELNHELEKLKEEISGSCPTYNGTIDHLMQSTILTSDEWIEFRKLFSQVYPGFFGSIRIKYPDLTETEERLLTLTKLNLSSREIASMLGISMDSVYKSRYRLCKKLDISSEEIETIVAALS
ncbi:MAG: hypothetical protein ABJG78_02415 [Cyclobacteriaceae bacterium]